MNNLRNTNILNKKQYTHTHNSRILVKAVKSQKRNNFFEANSFYMIKYVINNDTKNTTNPYHYPTKIMASEETLNKEESGEIC